MYDLDHVKKHLPHRDPFLLVDRVIEVDLGNKIHAQWDIKPALCPTEHEFYYQDQLR